MMTTTLIAMTVCVSQGQPIDTHTATRYFKEAESVSARDGGALWGMPLYGPVIFIAPAAGAAYGVDLDCDGGGACPRPDHLARQPWMIRAKAVLPVKNQERPSCWSNL